VRDCSSVACESTVTSVESALCEAASGIFLENDKFIPAVETIYERGELTDPAWKFLKTRLWQFRSRIWS